MIIGLVTSTKFSGGMRERFLAGLRKKGWEADHGALHGAHRRVFIVPYEADGRYDDGDGVSGKHRELYNAVTALDEDPRIDLIVAAGGLVSAHAAAKATSKKPFLVLVGNNPSFDIESNPRYRGGVNLDLVDLNHDRNTALCKEFGITDPKKICLIWNSNSKMGKEEKQAWVQDYGWPLHQQVRKNDDRDIADAFARAKRAGAKGVILSGDPFFTSRMNALVAAANASKLKSCYPFAAYAHAEPAPVPGSGIYFGPDLHDAYEEIGEMAGEILAALDSNASLPPTKLTTARHGRAVPVARKKSGSSRSTRLKKKK